MRLHHLIQLCLYLCLANLCLAQTSRPFEQCPSRAFLIQKSSAQIFGVNLATGFYELLEDNLGTQNKINALGFNTFDNYLYGYSSEWNTVVRINSEFNAEPLDIDHFPGASFYVGDVALTQNRYYAYRPGADYGLYYVDLAHAQNALSSTSDDTNKTALNWQQVISGDKLNLRIFDFAFHPQRHELYSVDSRGDLYRIDPVTGSSEKLTNVGQAGTFGAVYFDVNENFYISRNNDGFIFRINLKDAQPSAEFFAYGPSSSNNDGARCAIAEIIDDSSQIDFGDAPDSYGASVEDNGARHQRSDTLYIGSDWGGADDGIDFITNVEVGAKSIIAAEVAGEGYLNTWVDWDHSGSFDDNEQVITNQLVANGKNYSQINVPQNAIAGETWARVRYSSQQDIGANGGVADGEVEDYLVTVTDAGVAVEYYPSSSGFVTVAFEDNWPELGDYDMNDVVVAMRVERYLDQQNQVFRYDISGKTLAMGAGYHNGFAIQLDNISSQAIDLQASALFINGIRQASTLEGDEVADHAVFIIANDLKEYVGISDGCSYYRTEISCSDYEQNDEMDFSLTIRLSQPIAASAAPTASLNPFIFATPGIYHGDSFTTPPGRSLEIHLKNKLVSNKFNPSFWGLEDDRSDGQYSQFINQNNMPWALEMPGVWAHPKEKKDINHAYPGFKSFVESNGQQSKTWYEKGESLLQHIIENSWEK